MRKPAQNKGFTLIEILLVVVIIGLMLAVIVPRAWRANVDTKYSLVRQNCNELASFGMEWVERQTQAQPEDKGTTQLDYLNSLSNNYVARAALNWVSHPAKTVAIATPRSIVPEAVVMDIVPPEKHPRNPFNGTSVFVLANDPIASGQVVAGAIGCGRVVESSGYTYFAFVWQGTDSGSNVFGNPGTWHAGQTTGTLEGLRNGVFFARARN